MKSREHEEVVADILYNSAKGLHSGLWQARKLHLTLLHKIYLLVEGYADSTFTKEQQKWLTREASKEILDEVKAWREGGGQSIEALVGRTSGQWREIAAANSEIINQFEANASKIAEETVPVAVEEVVTILTQSGREVSAEEIVYTVLEGEPESNPMYQEWFKQLAGQGLAPRHWQPVLVKLAEESP